MFKKKGAFQPNAFQTNAFQTSTTPKNAPIDKETNKIIEEITTIDSWKTKFGVMSIVVGCCFNFLQLS